MQQLSQGDRKAFETIYSKYWRPLLDTAWKGLHDKQTAEDLVQGVFFSLWQKREQLQVHNLEAYLKTAVRYKVLNYVVRTKRTHEFFESFLVLKKLKKIASFDDLFFDLYKQPWFEDADPGNQ